MISSVIPRLNFGSVLRGSQLEGSRLLRGGVRSTAQRPSSLGRGSRSAFWRVAGLGRWMRRSSGRSPPRRGLTTHSTPCSVVVCSPVRSARRPCHAGRSALVVHRPLARTSFCRDQRPDLLQPPLADPLDSLQVVDRLVGPAL